MKNTEKAFIWILDILDSNKIPYKISGGFAARVHGVNRELADIDIEIPEKYLTFISDQVNEYITLPLQKFQDASWKLSLLVLNYEGQDIDICSTEHEIYNKQLKKWESLVGNINDCVSVKK